MKIALLALIGLVSAQDVAEATDAEKLEASETETDEAITNIENGLLNIPADEKAAYDKCMEGVTLPDKTTENTAHLLALNKCYNVVGKLGWHCQGNRRDCPEAHCCGKVTN